MNALNAADARFKNILDAGLGFSAMIRKFEEGAKVTILRQLLKTAPKILKTKSQKDFDKIHSEFCRWGTRTIRRSNSNPIRASYGQIAKTLNVALKVAVYYSHLPDCKPAERISGYLHAAVDNPMMKMLKRIYPNAFDSWPTYISQVDEAAYNQIRCLVNKFIDNEHNNQITPVQFDDIYWRKLNREE